MCGRCLPCRFTASSLHDVVVDDDLSLAQRALTASIDQLLLTLDQEGDVAAAASATEDAMEELHNLLELRFGIGLIAEWTAPDDEYDEPVVTVRLALNVLKEESRRDVLGMVDERLCQGLDDARFAILSTRRIPPGARGGAADSRTSVRPNTPASVIVESQATRPELSDKLLKLRQDLIDALQSLLVSLVDYGDHPRKKTRSRVSKRLDRFESHLARLHRKVMRRTGVPLVTAWAYGWGAKSHGEPVVLHAVFDVGAGETHGGLLTAISGTLQGLAPEDFSLASVAVLDE